MLNNGLSLLGAQLLPVKYAAAALIMQHWPPNTWEGKKNNECAFFHNVGEMGCCSSLFMSTRAYQSECICFVLLTADIKAVFWLQHLQ